MSVLERQPVEASELVLPDVDVLKVGTRALFRTSFDGALVGYNNVAFDTIGSQASEDAGKLIIVSSGAIANGMLTTNLKVRPDPAKAMPELQRLATIGQRKLLNRWDESISHNIGELLLTRHDAKLKESSEELVAVIMTMLLHRNVPICNENNGVSHEEISFGDNDILSAILAALLARSGKFGRVRLFLGGTVDGIYEDINDPSTRIPVIEDTRQYRSLIDQTPTNLPGSELGSGGVEGKFNAADIASDAGVDTWVYDASNHGHRDRVVYYDVGTHFPAKPAS